MFSPSKFLSAPPVTEIRSAEAAAAAAAASTAASASAVGSFQFGLSRQTKMICSNSDRESNL